MMLVKPSQNFKQKFCENHKISLDSGSAACYIIGARVREHAAFMRGSGRLLGDEVTSVEYVRCR